MGHCEKPIIKVEPFLDEQINTTKVLEDTEVDIVSWANKGDFASNKIEDPDATDYSSSFADTTSDAENGSRLSDAEVESEFLGDSGSLTDAFDGSAFPMRKRRLTDHWRNFIRPLTWRCKWTELRIKEIDSIALKYSKELAEYDKGKHTTPDQFSIEEFGSKSLPFLGEHRRNKANKRRKRKKVEDTTEIGSYTSHHYIFSYLENKKSDHDGGLADDFGNPVIIEPHTDSTDRFGTGEVQPFLDFSETDASLEQLLWAIDNLQARVHKLKSDVDAIMSKNASKFSSSENLSLLPHGDMQTSSAQSPTISAGNGDAASVGVIYNSIQHGVDFDIGDFVMHSVVSSYGEVPMVPDIIESTVGLLSAADVTFRSALAGDSCEAMVDNVLIHEVAETDEHTFKSGSQPPMERLQNWEKGEGEENLNLVSVPMSDINTVAQEQSTLKPCVYNDVSIPKNKRKRGERKACSGGWSKKCSGESENH
ncbi:hypothetical protein VIGAN_01284200 [Vigna angularis var. angularis]|uniref:Uncharacterized protein n=1 Tax=Vigna angularis var. angularis TaxID=157739 RepID=A0A0S3R2X3_PHAAN|nr:uncharacterized protein LOC108343792 isoform X1 [Vigna angularis]BAT75044.1 hypothetical protein VIGAN_01284200 [Vigna angularis var. angularis]